MIKKNKKQKRGFTIVDILIGVFLALIIFLGVFGAFRLGIKSVNQSRNKIAATAIANHWIEMVRNLPYEDVGTVGGFPEGSLDSSTTTISNGINFTVTANVDYVVDSSDGVAEPEDVCSNDYKKVEINVSWPDPFGGEVFLTTNVAPKNLAQECSDEGGILRVSVFDAYGLMVPFPVIEIRDPSTDEVIKSATPNDGDHYFSLATSTGYKVVVDKSGCSTARSYSVSEVASPDKTNPIVKKGALTEISFSIDETSSFSIDTLSPWASDSFSDSFDDSSKVSESSDVLIGESEVKLASSSGIYSLSGELFSNNISPSSLVQWDEFSWNDSESQNTDILYYIYYASGTDWYIVPESDLSGNSSGFDSSPLDLSSLNITSYPQLKIKGALSTNDSSITPVLDSWQVSWRTDATTSIGNVTFSLQGNKTIGTDSDENPVYKYSENHTSDSSGHLDLSGMEWDLYNFSISPSTGLDLIDIDPSPQPINLLPDNVNQNVTLYLDSENSLLVTVKNSESLDPVFSADVRLYNSGLGYDVTQQTDSSGQTYFIPLDPATYELEIEATNYSSSSMSVSVSGDETQNISLEQIE
jgi:type II secretory pathway pseudopilin PulG